jgi:hypothetical protein
MPCYSPEPSRLERERKHQTRSCQRYAIHGILRWRFRIPAIVDREASIFQRHNNGYYIVVLPDCPFCGLLGCLSPG